MQEVELTVELPLREAATAGDWAVTAEGDYFEVLDARFLRPAGRHTQRNRWSLRCVSRADRHPPASVRVWTVKPSARRSRG